MKDNDHNNNTQDQQAEELARNTAEDEQIANALSNVTSKSDPLFYEAQQRSMGSRNTASGAQSAIANAAAVVENRATETETKEASKLAEMANAAAATQGPDQHENPVQHKGGHAQRPSTVRVAPKNSGSISL